MLPSRSSHKKARQPWGHRAVWEETPDVGSGRRCADTGCPTLTLQRGGPAARRRISVCRLSMRRKPPHPDAEGIADHGADQYGKHQRPAADVVIEVHRKSTVCGLACTASAGSKAKACCCLQSFDVPYRGGGSAILSVTSIRQRAGLLVMHPVSLKPHGFAGQ